MILLYKKLKRLKQSLKSFNKSYFADVSMKVKNKKEELASVQKEILSNSSGDELMNVEKRLSKELYDLMVAEEGFYKQKSRIQWLKE